MIDEDPVKVLETFERWEAIGNPLKTMWYPSCDATRKTPGRSIGPIPDAEGVYISRCLASLKLDDPLGYEIIKLKYHEGKKLRQIAAWPRMPSRTIVDQRHLRALDYLKGMFRGYNLLH